MNRMRGLRIATVAVTACAVCGCGGNPNDNAPSMTAAEKQRKMSKQVSDIQNNPNMPPAAKAAAMAQIQASTSGGK